MDLAPKRRSDPGHVLLERSYHTNHLVVYRSRLVVFMNLATTPVSAYFAQPCGPFAAPVGRIQRIGWALVMRLATSFAAICDARTTVWPTCARPTTVTPSRSAMTASPGQTQTPSAAMGCR